MEFIAHRVNARKQLRQLPNIYGVEIDLRDHGRRLVIEHDPFKNGEDFSSYLKSYHHGTMILNIKSEGIEWKVLEFIRKYKIKKYFFLDSSFPMIMKLVSRRERNIALRYSEFEGLESVLRLKGKVRWVWVDSFERLSLTGNEYKKLKQNGFKLCLVSPELQGRPKDIYRYARQLSKYNIRFDAICTKQHNIIQWQNEIQRLKD